MSTRFPFPDLTEFGEKCHKIVQDASCAMDKYPDHLARQYLIARLDRIRGSELPSYLDAFAANAIILQFDSWVGAIDDREREAA